MSVRLALALFLSLAVVALTPASALAGQGDVAATREYLQVNYRLVQAAVSKIGPIEATLRDVRTRIGRECPMAAAGSPQDPDSEQLSNEVIGAMVTAAVHLVEVPASLRFVRLAGQLSWSDGAIIGLDLAIHHPDRLTALFAQAANASPDGLVALSRPDKRVLPSRLHRFFKEAKGLVVVVVENLGGRVSAWFGRQPATLDRSLALQEEFFELWATEPHYSPKQLASIRVRTEIVIGDHDDVIRLDHTKYLARTIPGAQLIIVHDVGHAALLQDPVGYAHAVLDFVDAPTPTRPSAVRQRTG